MRKYTDFVRITEGFYKGQLGLVVGRSSPHIHGIGEPPEEVYEILLVVGNRVVDVESKDLKQEALPEKKEEAVETQEEIETEASKENPEEIAEEKKEKVIL